MTIPTTGAVISLALQGNKYGDEPFDPAALAYYKMRVLENNTGAVQEQLVFPPEVGGTLNPQAAYKQALYFGGDTTFIPRLENSFGLLLKAALGACVTTPDHDYSGAAKPGVTSHCFKQASNPAHLPWFSLRRKIPGSTPALDSGETAVDCRMANLRFTVPAAGKLSCSAVVQGRRVVLGSPAGWAYANATFEDAFTTPDAGRGTFLIGGVKYPILGAQIDVVNGLTNPRDEMVIGSFNPDDFAPLRRGVQIRIVYKYQNDDLYRRLLTGQPDGTEWTSLPFYQDTAGTTKAFKAVFQAPQTIGSSGVPYTLALVANRVVWAVDGPIQLKGGGIITQTFVGTVLDEGTLDFFDVYLDNATASYEMTDLGVAAGVDETTPGVGDTVVWRVTVANYGGDDLSDTSAPLTLSVPLPAGQTFTAFDAGSSGATYTQATGALSIPATALAVVDSQVTVTISATVNTGEEGHTHTLTAAFTSKGHAHDTLTPNDTASQSVTIAS